MSLHERYRRLLRWYPREWRARNERVVLDTFADQAEASGRIRPPLGDAVSIIIHGLALRANDRMAASVAGAALALLALAGAAHLFLSDAVVPITDHALLGAALPILVLAATIPLANRSRVSPATAGGAVAASIVFSALLRVIAEITSSAPTGPWLFELISSSGTTTPVLLVGGGWLLCSAIAATLIAPTLAEAGRIASVALGLLLGSIFASVSFLLMDRWGIAVLGLGIFAAIAGCMGPAFRTRPIVKRPGKRTPTLLILVASLIAGIALPVLTEGFRLFDGVDSLLPRWEVLAFSSGVIASAAMARIYFQDGNRKGGVAAVLLCLYCAISLFSWLAAGGATTPVLATVNEVLLTAISALTVLALLDHYGHRYPLWTLLPLMLGTFATGLIAIIVQAMPTLAVVALVVFVQYLRPQWQLGRGRVPEGAVPNPLAAERAS